MLTVQDGGLGLTLYCLVNRSDGLKWRVDAVLFGTLQIAPIQDGDYLP